MIIQFKDRKRELQELKEVIGSDGFEFIIIYGRRRVGKTELVLKATEGVKRVYFLSTGEKDLERFYNVCMKQFPEIRSFRADWETLFDFLKGKVDAIIIDEFQNLVKENKKILNIFQSIIDVSLKNSRLKFFVLGSSVSVITTRVLDYSSPLYGRRTGSMLLKPVSFFDLKDFFPSLGIERLVEIYGFADGIPQYLVSIKGNLWSWLKKELKKERSFLKDEMDFLMRYEFEDFGTYKLILEAISHGRTKLNEIKDFIKAKRTDITPYLRNLINVGMVKRVVPVTENIKSKTGRYCISDNFVRFWFRFIYPNLTFIEERVFDVGLIRKEYSQYLGEVFENICRQFLIKKGMFSFTKIGRQWGKMPGAKPGKNTYEIDIVALNERDKEVLFGECKWQDKADAEKIVRELMEKSEYVEWNRGNRKESFAVFAKSFRKRTEEFEGRRVYCFDLRDLDRIVRGKG